MHLNASKRSEAPSRTSRRKFFMTSLSSLSAHVVAELNAMLRTFQNSRKNVCRIAALESDCERTVFVVRMPDRPEDKMAAICIDWRIILLTYANRYPRCHGRSFSGGNV